VITEDPTSGYASKEAQKFYDQFYIYKHSDEDEVDFDEDAETLYEKTIQKRVDKIDSILF